MTRAQKALVESTEHPLCFQIRNILKIALTDGVDNLQILPK